MPRVFFLFFFRLTVIIDISESFCHGRDGKRKNTHCTTSHGNLRQKTFFGEKMKNLRNIIAGALCAALAITAGCAGNQKTYSIYDGSSAWAEEVTAQKAEVCVYDVSYEKGKESGITFTPSEESKMQTTLQKTTENGEDVFLFTVEIAIKGSYVYTENGEEKTREINDRSITKCWFLSAQNRFLPLKSTVENDSIYPYQSKSGYSFAHMAYSSLTTYDKSKNKATAVITATEGVEDNGIKSSTRTYDKYNNSYFDNAQTMFLIRLADYEEGFYASYNSISILDGKSNSLKIAVDSSKPTDSIDLPECIIKGVKRGNGNPFNVFNVQISLSGTFSGTPIKFAVDSGDNGAKRIIKTGYVFAKNFGNIWFTLKEANFKTL